MPCSTRALRLSIRSRPSHHAVRAPLTFDCPRPVISVAAEGPRSDTCQRQGTEAGLRFLESKGPSVSPKQINYLVINLRVYGLSVDLKTIVRVKG